MDDFLTKKKETVPIMDLSQSTCNSNEEFRQLMEKIPDFKIRPEKVSEDQIKLREKNFKFKTSKTEIKKQMKEKYMFMNPLPIEMQKLKIDDLAKVAISWRMLTTCRPKNKMEEEYFSRIIELAKLENRIRENEKRRYQLDPQIRKIKTKSGVVEKRVVSCKECKEDFCDGKVCVKIAYDSFVRQIDLSQQSTSQKSETTQTTLKKNKKKLKQEKSPIRTERKSRSKSQTKQKEKSTKSKSPKKRSLSKHKNKKHEA